MTELDSNTLHELLHYNPDTGVLTWKHRPDALRNWNVLYAGKPAGTNSHGYVALAIKGRRYLAHRVIWFMVYGEWPKEIDHINRKKNDNRLVNLRSCTRSENMLNRGLNADNTSGVTGVSKHAGGPGWIVTHGTQKRAYRKTFEDAVALRESWAGKPPG